MQQQSKDPGAGKQGGPGVGGLGGFAKAEVES